MEGALIDSKSKSTPEACGGLGLGAGCIFLSAGAGVVGGAGNAGATTVDVVVVEERVVVDVDVRGTTAGMMVPAANRNSFEPELALADVELNDAVVDGAVVVLEGTVDPAEDDVFDRPEGLLES